MESNELTAEEMAVFYAVANIVIPTRAFKNCHNLVKETLLMPERTVVSMIIQATLTIGISIPDGINKLHKDRGCSYVAQFVPTHGNLKPDADYIVYPFPKPPALKILQNGIPATGVYFAALVYSPSSYEVRCYLLRPSVAQGSPNMTVLREITVDGMSLNLGDGCQPNLRDFISLLKKVESGGKHIYGAVR